VIPLEALERPLLGQDQHHRYLVADVGELDGLRDRWEPYRRCLRREDQERFDALFDGARRHADACGHLNPHEPLSAVLLSMLVEQQRRIDELERRLDGDGVDADADSTERRDSGRLKGTPGLEDG
jgi:hypothetical protein